MTKLTYPQIREKMQGKPYGMNLVGDDAIVVITAVNKGIDAHLEACNCPERGDRYDRDERKIGGKVFRVGLACQVSEESLPVLLRRLTESDDDRAWSLATDILGTLGFRGLETGCVKIVSPVDEGEGQHGEGDEDQVKQM